MNNKNNSHSDNLETLTADNAGLRNRVQDLETYIDGRKARWEALAARLARERQNSADLEAAVQVRDARISGFARKTARLERRLESQDREIKLLRGRLNGFGFAAPEARPRSDADSRIILRAAYDKLAAMREEQKRLKDEILEKNAYIDQLSGRLSELELERGVIVSELRKQRGIIDRIENDIRARLARIASRSRSSETQRAAAASISKIDKDRAQPRNCMLNEPVTTMGRLRLLSEDGSGIEYAIGERTLSIGRGPHSDIRLDRVSVSREHARVTPTVDGILIEDLGSRNGISVNGKRVTRRRLQSGDTVMIGHVKFRFTTSVIPFNRHNAS